ncbi:MAG: hypothetical protein L6R38_006737 [Xanthoria sp. 2 TBL-2021]|nr:MAG: hypothetical protein L6R38_006737 [Xanthoria sp. 2 TBL-2021]
MDSSFFKGQDRSGSSIRLRASVHLLNTNCSDKIRKNRQKRKVVESNVNVDSEHEVLECKVDASSSNERSFSDAQLLVTECEIETWVKEVYHSSRGKELPGNYNHVLLSELFYIQSSRWYQIAKDHLNSVHKVIVGFVKSRLRHIIHDERIFSDLLEIIIASLQTSQKNAEEELNKLWQDEKQQPITYNHYYTDNVQKSRQDTTRQMIRKAMEGARQEWGGRFYISNNQIDAGKLLASLQSHVTVDMDKQACSKALAGLNAYYKVALTTFVDNVCRQVIERHLLRTLPEIFNPETVAVISDGELERLAGEQPSDVEKRANLRALYRILSDSLRNLRR